MSKYIQIINNKISQTLHKHPFNNDKNLNLKDKKIFTHFFARDIDIPESDIHDISKKNNLFQFHINNNCYNFYIEHVDGGGRDISFNDDAKKVSIPFSTKSFRNLIKEMQSVLVIDLYFCLKEINGEIQIDYDNYCYLIVMPSKIYSAKPAYNILLENNCNPSPSSRWVSLKDIKKCIFSKQTLINSPRAKTINSNVWLVHPKNLRNFLLSVVLDDYKRQFFLSYLKLLEKTFRLKKSSKIESFILKARREQRNALLNQQDKCEIFTCDVSEKQCLIASHIWPVYKIISDENLDLNKKKSFISDPNNAFLLCPTHDKLFDRLLITFTDTGELICSKIIESSIFSYGLETNKKLVNVTKEKEFFLKKHRELFKIKEQYR